MIGARLLPCFALFFLLHCGDDAPSGGTAASAGASGKTGAAGSTSTQGGASSGGSGSSGSSGQTGSSGTSGQIGDSCATDGATHQGEGTYYDATGAGNCSFPATPGDLMVGAMNQADYGGSAACGACAAIDGPEGSVTVRIVDRCPECKPGDIDLSPQAFEKLAALEKGRIPITWRYVSCPVQGNLVYHFKDGSNPWWTAVQIRNHRFPVAKVEYKTKDGSFKSVERLDYNFFVEPSGMGDGPYTFRVTDTQGHVVEDSGIPLKDNDDVASKAQFPGCGGLPMTEPSHAILARRLVQQARRGSLATWALDPEGYPFASLVAVADDGEGQPLMLLSRLAEHTRNLHTKPEASLLLVDEAPGGDPLAGGRVTLIGPCVPLEDGEVAGAKRCFLEAHPEAKIYADFPDFRPYRLTPRALRYVGGFGRMSWVDPAAYQSAEGAP